MRNPECGIKKLCASCPGIGCGGRSVLCGVIAAALCLSSAIGSYAKYSDVPQTHWAYESIKQTSEWGWVNGVAVGRFEPDSEVTGAQFTVMIIRAFLPDSLDDRNGGLWYSVYGNAAAKLSLLDGTAMEQDKGAFDLPLSRYDMARMIYNYLYRARGDKLEDMVYVAEKETPVVISDRDTIPEEYRESVRTAFALGLLGGVDESGTFAGGSTLTRAQATSVLCRLDEYISANDINIGTGKVGTFSSKPVTLSYETHRPLTDHWAYAPNDIRKITDEDAYNAAVQTLKDQSRIRWAEGVKNGYTRYYNYAVYRRNAKLKETNVTGAMSRIGGGELGFTPRAVRGTGEALGFFGADTISEAEQEIDTVLAGMPSGTDKEKAEYLTKALCERFQYADTGAFTWTSLGRSGTGNSFSNAAAALFTRAGIPYICASGKNEAGARFWGYTFLDGKWYVTDVVSQEQDGKDHSHIEIGSFSEDGSKGLDTFTRVAMALTEAAAQD